MKVYVKGMEELNSYFNNVPQYMQSELLTALKKICADLQHDAMELAPKQTGALRGSAHSEVATSGNVINGYVGFFMPYATTQHERLDFKHEQGQAKYLETPYKENINKYIEFAEQATLKAVTKR